MGCRRHPNFFEGEMIGMKKFNKTLKFEIWEVIPYVCENDFGNVLLLINADETDEEKFIANCSAYMDCVFAWGIFGSTQIGQ